MTENKDRSLAFSSAPETQIRLFSETGEVGVKGPLEEENEASGSKYDLLQMSVFGLLLPGARASP